jgi:membrane protease YdiL (CAAX protease family)
VATFGLAALTPATRPLLNDRRIAGLDRRELAYQVLLRIPVGTVAWEEIAFRGVLQATLRRVLAEPVATAVGSAVFGLWHIRPTAEALAVNGLAPGRGARVAAVAGVVAGTAGAGAALSLLRERSGSLAAPVLLHLAANCAGPLASALARKTATVILGQDAGDELPHLIFGDVIGLESPGGEMASDLRGGIFRRDCQRLRNMNTVITCWRDVRGAGRIRAP